MTVTIRVPAWRSLALLLTGAVLGAALMAPVTSGVTTYTRSASCAGLSFYPVDGAPYGQVRTLRIRTSRTGTGYFLCDPGLPNGAVVTKVEFTLFDGTQMSEVSNCALVRSGLTPSTVGSAEVMANVPSTGIAAIAPDAVRPFDDTIAFATINNAQFGYYLQCQISESDFFRFIGIYGADVTYKITAAKG